MIVCDVMIVGDAWRKTIFLPRGTRFFSGTSTVPNFILRLDGCENKGGKVCLQVKENDDDVSDESPPAKRRHSYDDDVIGDEKKDDDDEKPYEYPDDDYGAGRSRSASPTRQ